MIPHWSFSSLKTLANCPRSWWWQYVKGEKQPSGDSAQFGLAFDQAVLKRLGIEPEKTDKPVTLNAEAQAELDEAVQFYLSQPQAWTRAERGQAKVLIEPHVWSELADVYGVESEIKRPFIGYIDLLRHEGMSKQVLDLKTSSRMEYRAEWVLQTTLYALAEHASECHVHLLVRGKKGCRMNAYRFRPIPATYAWALVTMGWLARLGEEVMRMQEYQLPMTAGYYCEWCPKVLGCEAARLQKVEEY